MNLTDLFDNYGRQARLYPAILTMAPVVLLPGALRGLEKLSSYVVIGVVVLALLYGMTHWVRTLGKQAEAKLIRKWGGMPTTRYLRWRDDTLDPTTKRRYHDFLRSRGLLMPTANDEHVDQSQAEERLASAATWLRNNRRGEQFALLHAENASYGFRRNLYGAKPIGISITIVVVVLIAWPVIRSASQLPTFGLLEIFNTIEIDVIGRLLLTLVLLAGWLLLVTAGGVREAANLYAKALLETCDTASG